MVLVGIFVGGKSVRMGGHPKGLLDAPDGGTLLERAIAIGRAVGDVVLVGDASPYAALTIEALEDEPRGVGPLGGLHALLQRATTSGGRYAIALACDMPFVTLEDLRALADARQSEPVVAAKRARWEPFLARYDAPRMLPVVRDALARGERSLQRVLASVEVAELAVSARAADDWDEPADVTTAPAGTSRRR